MDKQMYVLRSECETITKFGNSQYPEVRLDLLCGQEKAKYYLLYQSHPIDGREALDLELKISAHFKSDIIKGKEWLSTHPLEVIKFIVDEIGLNNKKDLVCNYDSTFPSWISDSQSYKNCSISKENGIKTGAHGVSFIRLVNNLQFIVMAFCNTADAERFARKNKHNIQATPIITEILHGITYKEWAAEKMNGNNKYKKWTLL